MTTDGREELRSRIRDGAPPPDAAVVIRGGPDTLSLLRSHARRTHRLYVLDGTPIFGVSVFVASDEIGPACERRILAVKLRSYPTLYRTTVGKIEAAGFSLLATFSEPHFTVVLPSIEAVDGLVVVFGELVANRYAQ